METYDFGFDLDSIIASASSVQSSTPAPSHLASQTPIAKEQPEPEELSSES